jgi:hypothetical protein
MCKGGPTWPPFPRREWFTLAYVLFNQPHPTQVRTHRSEQPRITREKLAAQPLRKREIVRIVRCREPEPLTEKQCLLVHPGRIPNVYWQLERKVQESLDVLSGGTCAGRQSMKRIRHFKTHEGRSDDRSTVVFPARPEFVYVHSHWIRDEPNHDTGVAADKIVRRRVSRHRGRNQSSHAHLAKVCY